MTTALVAHGSAAPTRPVSVPLAPSAPSSAPCANALVCACMCDVVLCSTVLCSHVSCMHSRERNHFSARLSATVRLRFDIYTRRRQTTMSDRDRMTLDPHTPLSRVWARRRHMITKRSLARPTSTPRRRRNGTRSLRSLQRPPLHSASAAVRGCPATQEEFAWTGDAAEEMSIMRQKLPAALAVPSAVLETTNRY